MPKHDDYSWPTNATERRLMGEGEGGGEPVGVATAAPTESQSEHAPLPWRYVGGRDSAGPFTIRVPLGAVPYGLMGDYLGDIVAEIQQNPSDQLPGMAEANAAFIVTSVNSHDALLAACKTARYVHEHTTAMTPAECAQLEAAINLAEQH